MCWWCSSFARHSLIWCAKQNKTKNTHNYRNRVNYSDNFNRQMNFHTSQYYRETGFASSERENRLKWTNCELKMCLLWFGMSIENVLFSHLIVFVRVFGVYFSISFHFISLQVNLARGRYLVLLHLHHFTMQIICSSQQTSKQTKTQKKNHKDRNRE